VVAALAHVLIGDDDWDWAEFAVRVCWGGVLVLIVASTVPPSRLRSIQRPLRWALRTGRLPEHVDAALWREGLLHQRGLVWIFRRLAPGLLSAAALLVAVVTLVTPPSGARGLWLIATGLCVFAAGMFVLGGRRRATIDGLLAELD
jgi:hypothetical protein